MSELGYYIDGGSPKIFRSAKKLKIVQKLRKLLKVKVDLQN